MNVIRPVCRLGIQPTLSSGAASSAYNLRFALANGRSTFIKRTPVASCRHLSQTPATSSPSSHRHHHRGHSTRPPPYIIYGLAVPAAGIAVAAVYAYQSCVDYVPYTNRKRFIATNPEWEAAQGHQQYKDLLAKYGDDVLPKDHRASVTVKRVGGNIAKAAQEFTRQYNTINSINSSPFTYTVVRSDEANAFVLPGNHVFVFTGLFKYAHNEDELASVLGHECAHNVCRHAGERSSSSIVVKLLSHLALLIDPSGMLFGLFVSSETLFYSLPHSREHEVEADEVGLVLSSAACYDPKQSKAVFARMKHDMEDGDANVVTPPEFISTHPGYETRLDNFDKWMPDALDRFNRDDGAKCRAVRHEMKRARELASIYHGVREGRRKLMFHTR
jgi:predicted Zn-dependent protease|eukprot:g6823.t1 g6823   contig23:1290659-1291822(+)